MPTDAGFFRDLAYVLLAAKVFPRLLPQVARTQSRELFLIDLANPRHLRENGETRQGHIILRGLSLRRTRTDRPDFPH